jgi:hypothetical protein
MEHDAGEIRRKAVKVAKYTLKFAVLHSGCDDVTARLTAVIKALGTARRFMDFGSWVGDAQDLVAAVRMKNDDLLPVHRSARLAHLGLLTLSDLLYDVRLCHSDRACGHACVRACVTSFGCA